MEWWASLAACVVVFLGSPALAHDDAYPDTLKAPNGGQLRMAGPNHYELVPEVVMHKDPNCGCCSAWAEHLTANGFRVKTVATDDMRSVKRRFAVPQRLTSCHTAKVGSYVIEGHVSAAAIKRLMREKPAVAGLSAPGMPLGSPGMEVPGKKDAYDVVSFDKSGRSAVFESHR